MSLTFPLHSDLLSPLACNLSNSLTTIHSPPRPTLLFFPRPAGESNKEAYYATLKDRIKELAAVGFTALWLPPPSESVSPQGYLPRDLYNLNSTYGTEAELRELIMEIKEHGMMAVADVVVNHRCAHYQARARVLARAACFASLYDTRSVTHTLLKKKLLTISMQCILKAHDLIL